MEIINQQLAEDVAGAVTTKILSDLTQMDESFERFSDEWADRMDKTLIYVSRAREGLSTAQAYALAIIKRRWDEFPLSFRVQYNGDFWLYACLRTGRQMRRLELLVDAAEIFLIEEIKPFGSVEVPVRDDTGKVIDGKVEYKEWKPEDVPLNKLVLVKDRAKNNQMTPELWSMIMDNVITPTEVQSELLGVGKGILPKAADHTMRFRFEGPTLVASENGISIALGEFDCWDQYYNDPSSLEHRALKRMIAVLGIRMDDEIILNTALKEKRTNGYYTEDEA